MKLILIRHGKAEDFNIDGDFARPLVEKGRNQARKAARVLKAAGELPHVVLTSPLVRARQTADEFCKTAEIPGATLQGWLACGMNPETAMRELATFMEFENVAIVGHEPDLSGLLDWLLGTTSGGVQMKKGAIACVEIDPPEQCGDLVFLIPPALIEDEVSSN